MNEMTWEDARETIRNQSYEYLQKIEWYYGDNRAPFAWPPSFARRPGLFGWIYVCKLFYYDEGIRIMKAKSPSLLTGEVQKALIPYPRFGSDSE